MGVKVTRDGQIMDVLQGFQKVGTRDVALSDSRVCYENETFPDDKVPPHLLERIKAGEHSGFTYYEGDEPDDTGSPQPDSDSAAGLDQEPEEQGDAYDPTDKKQDEVLVYLKDADADEVKRVQQVEADGPHKRKGIAEFEPKAS